MQQAFIACGGLNHSPPVDRSSHHKLAHDRFPSRQKHHDGHDRRSQHAVDDGAPVKGLDRICWVKLSAT